MFSSTPETPVYYLSKKQLFTQSHWRKRALPVYLKACQFFGATLIDRTKTLETGIDFKVIDPMITPIAHIDSFEALCEQRAYQLIELAKGRTIRVLWSGGIDSTVALIALESALAAKGNMAQLKVLLSTESIAEFPSFFQEKIEGKLDFTLMKTTIYEHLDQAELNLTGEHGDQLFGSDKLKYWVQSGEAFRPYQEILDYVISRKLGTEKHTQALIDYLAPQLSKSPIPIHTLYDYLWWMNFSMKWQNVSMRLIHGMKESHELLNQSIFHFFQSTDFQQWSLLNHHQKIDSTWNSYKQPAKDYIYQYHDDKDYWRYKEKEPSLKQVIVGEPQWSLRKWPVKMMRQFRAQLTA